MRPARTLCMCLVGAVLVVSGLLSACTVLLPTEDLLVFCVRQEECPSGLSCSGGVCLPDGPTGDGGVGDEGDELGEGAGVDGGPES